MNQTLVRRDGTCFFEADPDLSLARRASAEGFGTFCLMFTVVSSALLWGGAPNLGPIARTLAVGPTLTSLILLYGSVSGGHYNPLISLAQTLLGRRSVRCLAGYVVAQAIGAVLGAQLADWVFGRTLSTGMAPLPMSAGAEVFATAGLMTIVLAAPRIRPAGVGPFAVAGWIAMTIVGLPAGPAANPAITLAVFLCARPSDLGGAAVHFAAELLGLLIAIAMDALVSPAHDDRP